jgi:hypothetical protein
LVLASLTDEGRTGCGAVAAKVVVAIKEVAPTPATSFIKSTTHLPLLTASPMLQCHNRSLVSTCEGKTLPEFTMCRFRTPVIRARSGTSTTLRIIP